MKKCGTCGLETCSTCGGDLYKRFGYFIDKTEVIYAILMAYGFAVSAQAVILASNWELLPLLIVNAFILMRFFYAPSRNLKEIAKSMENTPRLQFIIFLFDFPFLILHSLVYLAMCLAFDSIRVKDLYGPQYNIQFYRWLITLLALNVIWLSSITARIHFFGKNKELQKFFRIWIINNFSHLLIFWVLFTCSSRSFATFWHLFFSKNLPNFAINSGSALFWLLFIFSITNSLIDFILAAPCYLGLDRKSD